MKVKIHTVPPNKKNSYFRQTYKKLSNSLKETRKNINKQFGKVKSSTCSSIPIYKNLMNDLNRQINNLLMTTFLILQVYPICLRILKYLYNLLH